MDALVHAASERRKRRDRVVMKWHLYLPESSTGGYTSNSLDRKRAEASLADNDNTIHEHPVILGAVAAPPEDVLKRPIEAILFAAEGPLDLTEIRACLGEVARDDVRGTLKALGREYADRSFFLFESGGRYQMRTRPEYADVVSRQFSTKPRNLSKAAIETLALIAYKQPCTRAEINAARGTDSSSIVGALKEKDLILVSGQRKEVGSPLEFRTTQKFLEVFGLAGLKDLPSLRSLQMNPENSKQVAAALAELDGTAEPEELPSASELSFPEDPIPSIST